MGCHMIAIGPDYLSPVRAGLAVLAAAIIVVAVRPAEVLARHKYRHVVNKHVQEGQALAAPQASGLGTMRYFGGPKSPMWRDVK
jgi:hypothetical protein